MAFKFGINQPHSALATGVAVGAMALLPASAFASKTTFGSSLDHSPANAGSSCQDDGVMVSGTTCTHVGSYYPGNSGHARSPVNGTIIKIKIEPQGPLTATFHLVKVRNVSSDHQSGQAEAASKAKKTINLPGPTQDQLDNGDFPVDTIKVNMKVKKGWELALDTTSNTAEYCSDGTPGQLLFDPVLTPGQGFANSASFDGCLMLVQAVVKTK